MTEDLRQFVKEALGAGLSRPEIESKLQAAGWPRDEVAGALGAYADIESPVPVPRPRPYLSAAEAFVYLVLFLTLYTSAIALVNLLFQLINQAFPDQGVAPWQAVASSVRWATASLVISFPVFLWLSRRTYVALRENPNKRGSKVRKWLSYMTLVVAAAVLLCDVITLVYFFLAGELTVRFLLKFAVVAGVAGAVFGYYLWHLRQDDVDPAELRKRHRGVRLLVATATGVVAFSVVMGFFVAGTPGTARGKHLDKQRVQDLTQIGREIDGFWKREGRLPENLDELVRDRRVSIRAFTDPATEEPYEYRVTGESSFEMCATFDRTNAMHERQPYTLGSRFWAHEAGRTCYQLDALTSVSRPGTRGAAAGHPGRGSS